MPSGRTHDLITLGLGLPTFLGAWLLGAGFWGAVVATIAMVFGGLMFGPDLDTNSRQYQRWGVMRWLWWPYRVLMPHRSRFTHGIILGTVVRIIYFLTVTIALAALLLTGLVYWQAGRVDLTLLDGNSIYISLSGLDRRILISALAGLWWGSASHSIVDFLHSTFKQLLKLI